MKWIKNFFNKIFCKKNDVEVEVGEQVIAALTNSEAYQNYQKVIEAQNAKKRYSMNQLKNRLEENIRDAVNNDKLTTMVYYMSNEIDIEEIKSIYLEKGYKIKITDESKSHYNNCDRKITLSWDHFRR